MKKMIVIAGPCVIESEDMVMSIGERLKKDMEDLPVDYYFKASFDKANRTSISSFRGPGIEEGCRILKRVKEELNIKVLTDIHEPWQAEVAAEAVDVIQIPAFLCRQTDLLIAAAKTGKTINVKKAQFLAPWDMKNVVKKIEESGNHNIWLCERGTSFGYNSLVVDMTSLPEMKNLGYPVIFDATHSVQKPGGAGNFTSGRREYAPVLAKSAMAAGADGLFLETHFNPDEALSDAANMLPLSMVKDLVTKCIEIRNVVNDER